MENGDSDDKSRKMFFQLQCDVMWSDFKVHDQELVWATLE